MSTQSLFIRIHLFREVDHVSQIVPTGTSNPPDRWAYGYQSVATGEGREQVPFLHTITVPSPTGSGNSVSTINYQASTDYVSSTVDANGNTRAYTAVDQTHTKVTLTNRQQQSVYSYTVGFDNNLDKTTVTDGTNSTLVYSASYSDPNDPYNPSQVQDGNGYAVAQAAKGPGVSPQRQHRQCTSLLRRLWPPNGNDRRHGIEFLDLRRPGQ